MIVTVLYIHQIKSRPSLDLEALTLKNAGLGLLKSYLFIEHYKAPRADLKKKGWMDSRTDMITS